MTTLRGFVFDIDGCLMRGPRTIPGAPEALAALRSRGLAVRYFTNDSSKTPAEIAARLERGGFVAAPGEVLTAALVAADYAAAHFAGGRVVAVGGPALIEALEGRGLRTVQEWPAEAVLVGRDQDFSYRKLEAACQAIWKGAAFMATNMDRRMPVEDGFVPGTGSVVKAVAWATGRSPVVMGKPSDHAGRSALRSLGMRGREVAVVGDQLEQDVRMGKRAGAVGVLVLTGSSTRADIEHVPPASRPDAVLSSVAQLTEWLDGRVVAQGGEPGEDRAAAEAAMGMPARAALLP